MKLALFLIASALSAQIFSPPGAVRRYLGTPTAGDCTSGSAGRKAANIAAVPTVPYYCGQTSTDVWEWVVEAAGSGSGDVLGGSNLTTAGACVYVSASGTLNQDSPGCHWDATNNRLGLGTASPAALIDLAPANGVQVKLQWLDSGTYYARLNKSVGNLGLIQFAGSGSYFGFQTANSYAGTLVDVLSILTTGQVGIGPSNTSPSGTLHVYDATATTGVTTLTVRAGAGQSTTNLLEVKNSAGTNVMSVAYNGGIVSAGNVFAGGSGGYFWAGRSYLLSGADGNIALYANSGTDFARLQFGGTTNLFPSWKRNTTALSARLADDSADAPISASLFRTCQTEADGCWQFIPSGSDMILQYRTGGAWVTKATWTP